MRRKGLWISLGLLAVVTGFCILTAYGTGVWIQSSELPLFGVYYNTSAQVEDSIVFDGGGVETLKVELSNGDIEVVVGRGDQIQVEIVKTGWGPDEAGAAAVAESLELNAEMQGDSLTLTYETPERQRVVLNQGGVNSVDVKITLPGAMDVDLRTNIGSVTTGRLVGAARIHTEFVGDILVEDHTGALSAETSSGSLTITNVLAANETIRLTTQFGDVETSRLSADQIEISVRYGSITVENVTAQNDIAIVKWSGKLILDGFEADSLELESRSEAAEIKNGSIENQLEIRGVFGDLKVSQVEASFYWFEVTHTAITLEGAAGEIGIESGFGSVEISQAQAVVLNVEAQNGSVTFSGSLHPERAHQIKAEYGNVELTIPEDSAFDVSLEAEYGRITSTFDVALSEGGSENVWDGEINGGGPPLAVTTRNGSIDLIISVHP